jgi:hypothetical protein
MSAQVAAPHPTNHRGIPGREAEEMPRMYPEDAPRMCLMHNPLVAAPHPTSHRGAPGREAEDAPRMYPEDAPRMYPEDAPRMYPEDAPRMYPIHSPPVAAPHLTTHRGAPGREAEDAPRMYVDAHSVSGTPGGRSPRRCPV